MRRPAVVVLAVLLAVGPAASALHAGPAVPAAGLATTHVADPVSAETPGNTSRILPVGPEPTTGYVTVGPSLSAALSTQYDRSADRLDRGAALAAIDGAPVAVKRSVLESLVDRAAGRVEGLESALAANRRAMANGSQSAAVTATRAGTIASRAAAYRASLLAVRRAAGDGDEPLDADRAGALLNRTAELAAAYERLSGPVSERLAAAVAGERPPVHVFVAASGPGLVLSTVDAGRYYREAIRPDNADDVAGRVDLDAGLDKAASLYPWAWNASLSGSRQIGRSPPGVYRASLDYPNGTLTAYIDASSGGVVREIQSLNLSSYPAAPAVTRAPQSGLVVSVNRTYAGGPLRVSLRTVEGQPVDGEVRVEGRYVGDTGADGTLWTVSPAGRGDDLVLLTVEREGVELPLSYRLTGDG